MNHFNILIGGCSPSIDEGFVRPPLIKHKERNRTKFWDLTET